MKWENTLGQNSFMAMFLQDFISLEWSEPYCISWQSVNKSLGNSVFFSSVTLSQQLERGSLVSKNAKSFPERQSEKGMVPCWYVYSRAYVVPQNTVSWKEVQQILQSMGQVLFTFRQACIQVTSIISLNLKTQLNFKLDQQKHCLGLWIQQGESKGI